VDVSVEQPGAVVNRSVRDEAIVVVAVASVREMAETDLGVTDADGRGPVTDFAESGIEVSLGPPGGAPAVPCPATVVVAREQDDAPTQRAGERERVSNRAECEVAEDPDGVVVGDDLVQASMRSRFIASTLPNGRSE